MELRPPNTLFPLFPDLQELLRVDHTVFSDDPNPIKTLMQFDKGRYFLPAFHTLCRHFWLNSRWLADQLYALLDTRFHSLLDAVREIDPEIVHYASRDLTLDTLHFCANDMSLAETPVEGRLEKLVENNKRFLLSSATNEELGLLRFVRRRIQERYLPVRIVSRPPYSTNEPCRCIWNPATRSWQELTSSLDLLKHVNRLWHTVRQTLLNHSVAGDPNPLVDRFVVDRFDAMDVVTDILNDTKQSTMDTHEWFLRLDDESVLDLLTGHVGAVVPEYFMSDLKTNIGIPRDRMVPLCRYGNGGAAHPLGSSLYETLTNRDFLDEYLQALHLNRTDDFYEPLFDLVKDEFAVIDLSESMLRFYISLCKWTCFDYDRIVSVLNSLASAYVGGTHSSERGNIFVWRGTTCNGKTTLFELMKRVLGGYYHHHHHTLSGENFPSRPEPFDRNYRMVTSEAIGESFVKFVENTYRQEAPCKIFVATTDTAAAAAESNLSEAVRDRVVEIPFNATFTNKNPLVATTCEQNRTHSYASESGIVDASYKGCFLMLYYHLKKHIDPINGALTKNPVKYVV